MFAVPQLSSNQNEKTISKFHQLLSGQQEDLTLLCTIMEYVKGSLQSGLEKEDIEKYHHKIKGICKSQSVRYDDIDMLVNTNIFQMKKGKTTDNTALVFGKEVRKLESGLRTLILFAQDAISMLDKTQKTLDRSHERTRYFENRSKTLEAEIILFTKKLSLL